ncbi:MAG TPA: DUF2892 domain-containing protein [Flavobacteriales bacterium]|nr:DUF2892 domain-containing protein [Flavobacteriales bacterium]
MKTNMGTFDRALRLAAAIAVIVLYFAGIITGTLAIVLLVIAGVFILTSLIGFCPLYQIFGFSTCPKKKSTVL